MGRTLVIQLSRSYPMAAAPTHDPYQPFKCWSRCRLRGALRPSASDGARCRTTYNLSIVPCAWGPACGDDFSRVAVQRTEARTPRNQGDTASNLYHNLPSPLSGTQGATAHEPVLMDLWCDDVAGWFMPTTPAETLLHRVRTKPTCSALLPFGLESVGPPHVDVVLLRLAGLRSLKGLKGSTTRPTRASPLSSQAH